MDKIYPAARAAAVLYAIIGAFIALPESGPVLLILGGISALGSSSDDSQKVLLTAVGLSVCAPLLQGLPVAGGHLSTIFSSLGAAYAGAAIVSVAMGLVARIRSDWA